MCMLMDKLPRRDKCNIPQIDPNIETFILRASAGFRILTHTFWGITELKDLQALPDLGFCDSTCLH